MRYDKAVYFQTIEKIYNKESGNYESTVKSETMRMASVNQTGTDMIALVYQSLPEESLTIRLQNHYTDKFDYIRIGDKRYKVDKRIDLYSKQCFVVSEVH